MRSYAILPTAAITPEQWAAAISTQANARTSTDGSLTVLQWEGETPEPFEGQTILSHSAVLSELVGPTWDAGGP